MRLGHHAGTEAAEPSLRQLVEAFAEEQGVELVPKAGRRQDGLQVLACKPMHSLHSLHVTLHTWGHEWLCWGKPFMCICLVRIWVLMCWGLLDCHLQGYKHAVGVHPAGSQSGCCV